MLGEIAAGITGPWLRALLVPGLLVGAVTMTHQVIKQRAALADVREARIEARGRQKCIAEVELATAKAALAAEQHRARLAMEAAEAERAITRGVEDAARKLEVELEEVRRASVAETDLVGRCCISRGVCGSLRGAAAADGGSSPAGPASGTSSAPRAGPSRSP